MAGYTLYGDKGSGSFTPEALLAEAGAQVARVAVPLASDAQLRADFLRINPLGRIPALVTPEGQVVTESAAILLTIGERHAEAGLLPPPGTAERATLYRWLMFIAGNVYPAVTRMDYPTRFHPDPAAAETIRATAREELRTLWRIVETHLAPAPFALGDRFSALDVYIANLSRWDIGHDWRAAHCPRIQALADRVKARPAIAPVWARHFEE